MIYFDQAATVLPKPESVAQACYDAVRWGGNGGRGGHDAALVSLRQEYAVRCQAAELFGLSKPERACFTGGATDGLNIALNGLLNPGDHVITTALEHNSVLRPLYRLQEQGVELTVLPLTADGEVEWAKLDHAVKENTRVLVCCHGSNLTGAIQPLNKLGEFCKIKGIAFLVDAAQTAGLFPIHMEQMGIHVLVTAGHKSLLGPQGIGLLLVSDEIMLRPFRVGGTGVQSARQQQPEEYPTRLEAGTQNGPGIAGLGAAMEWLKGQDRTALRKKEQTLAKMFYEGVNQLPGIRFYGNYTAENRCPIVSLNLADRDSALVADQLAQRFSIAVRPGLHCAPLVHRTYGTTEQGMVRFSFSHVNTEDEVREGIFALQTLALEG